MVVVGIFAKGFLSYRILGAQNSHSAEFCLLCDFQPMVFQGWDFVLMGFCKMALLAL